MFSTVGNIFTTKPPGHEAQSTDTRLGIRRHDPEFQRGQHNNQEDPQSGFDEDDDAVVSIKALKLFLENILKERAPAAKSAMRKAAAEQETLFDVEEHRGAQLHQTQQSSHAAMAANAYQRGARALPQKEIINNTQKTPTQGAKLSAEDTHIVHGLLNDLKTLSARNIQYLRIERSESFLGSLVAAVNAATS